MHPRREGAHLRFYFGARLGPYGGNNNNQILRVNMANIRRKLKEDPSKPKYIHTELGIGYRMLED